MPCGTNLPKRGENVFLKPPREAEHRTEGRSAACGRCYVLGDYSIIESEREGMVAGPEPTAYGLFADFVNAVKSR